MKTGVFESRTHRDHRPPHFSSLGYLAHADG